MSIYRFPSVSEFVPEPAGLQATFSDAIIVAARSKRKAYLTQSGTNRVIRKGGASSFLTQHYRNPQVNHSTHLAPKIFSFRGRPKPTSSHSPGGNRTPDQRFRKPLLYPSELRGRVVILTSCDRFGHWKRSKQEPTFIFSERVFRRGSERNAFP